jgi:hypothetical protein
LIEHSDTPAGYRKNQMKELHILLKGIDQYVDKKSSDYKNFKSEYDNIESKSDKKDIYNATDKDLNCLLGSAAQMIIKHKKDKIV